MHKDKILQSGQKSDLSDTEGMTTDGDEALSKRKMMVEIQEKATKQILDEMKAERDELVAHFDKETDLSEKILIEGVKKVCVLGMIKYHQMRVQLFEEISMHPEILKGFEILHYHVENNFPIEKELVFQLVPELFVHEINKLGFNDRKRFKKPRISYTRADGEQLEVDDLTHNELVEEEDLLFERTMNMEMYLLE